MMTGEADGFLEFQVGSTGLVNDRPADVDVHPCEHSTVAGFEIDIAELAT
jgi:hypothetical protein